MQTQLYSNNIKVESIDKINYYSMSCLPWDEKKALIGKKLPFFVCARANSSNYWIMNKVNYRVYQGFSLNLDKSREMIIFGSLFTTLEMSIIFVATGPVAKISKPKIKPPLSKSLIHTLLAA